jgi:hypothetical protein
MAVILIALGGVPMANYLTLADRQRWWPIAVRQWLGWSIVVGGLALLLARYAAGPVTALRQRVRAQLLAPTPRAFEWGVGALTAALALLFGWILFHFQGATIDELSEQWQAHILTSGRLVARAEPHGEFFSTMQTVSWQGRWFAHFPIGGPALQAVGLRLHLPALVNPVLAGAAAMAVYRFCSAIGSELEARGTALLFALSPFVLFIAASHLDHVGALAAIWIALAAVPHWMRATRDHDAWRPAAVIGLGLGFATAIRPYDGLLAAIAVGVFQLAAAGRNAARWRALVVQALAGALPIACLLAANRAMTGHPLTFAYDILNGADHRPGFHMSPLGFTHTPRHGLYLVSSYLMRLNAALLAWPVPAVAIAALAMGLQRRVRHSDLLLVTMLAVTLVGYFLYWGEGSFNGPRFLYEVGPVFLIYIVRLPALLADRTSSATGRGAAALLIPLWLAIAWLAPPSGARPFGVWTLARRARQVDAFTPRLLAAVRARHLANAVVFVPDGLHARLTARLRALGAPPFLAQQMVGRYDACAIAERLDAAERSRAPSAAQAAYVFALLDAQSTARPLPGLSAMEQLALDPGRPVASACRAELDHARADGVDFARLLPLVTLDSLGRLGGDVVFARDFGSRNEMLRDRFGDRDWFVARVDSLEVALRPYAAATGMAAAGAPGAVLPGVAPHRTGDQATPLPPR